jgi:hypothetical protein
VHASGWRAEHCGHPTANYPWAVYGPTTGEVLHRMGGLREYGGNPATGHAFDSLRRVVKYVAEQTVETVGDKSG